MRDVDGPTFVGALEEALAPRLRITGETGALQQFADFFGGRTLAKGSALLMLWAPEGRMEVATVGDRARSGAAWASPDAAELTIPSAGLCRALFEVYLGESSVVPTARAAWAKGARALLATEEVKRDTRKGGS